MFTSCTFRLAVGALAWVALFAGAAPAQDAGREDPWRTGAFAWRTAGPVLLPADTPGDTAYSVKDPSIVRFDGRWHLFCTVRGKKRSHCIVYLNFADWADAAKAERHVLGNHAGFFCAPQVFYFKPHKKWYLICQASSKAWEPNYGPAFATADRIDAPNGWSALEPLFKGKPEGVSAWLDFWVICDDARAHLFFTSLDGRMWRSATKLADFPKNWSAPVVALKGDVFEASHTYRLQGRDQYLTVIEAQNGHGWRYYKAYLASRLDGAWKPLAAEKDTAFASLRNVTQAQPWTDAVSHGELLRAGHDERLEVDPKGLRFLIQGVLDADRKGKPYGEIPWRLGLLEAMK